MWRGSTLAGGDGKTQKPKPRVVVSKFRALVYVLGRCWGLGLNSVSSEFG